MTTKQEEYLQKVKDRLKEAEKNDKKSARIGQRVSVDDCPLNYALYEETKILRPKRIILVRHGESVANATKYEVLLRVPDNKIMLTKKGYEQAKQAGIELKKLIGNESIRFYVSPYFRTRQTFNAIMESFQDNVTRFEYDLRIREQEYGNLQSDMANQFEMQAKCGKLFYRFKDGESGADVYSRVTDFTANLFRNATETRWDNVIIVSHELTIGFFLHNFFKMQPRVIDSIRPFKNCEYFVLERGDDKYYKFDTLSLFKEGTTEEMCFQPEELSKYDEEYENSKAENK